MERIIYNGGLDIDIKEKKEFTNKECIEMERMLQNKIKEFSEELEKKFKIKILDVDMPCVGNVEVDD